MLVARLRYPLPRRVGSSRRRAPLVVQLGALVAAAVALLPLVYIGVRASQGGWEAIRTTLSHPATIPLLIRTLWLALTVSAASVVLGVWFAWLVTSTNLWGRQVWQFVMAMPLAMPTYVAGMGWISFRPDLAGYWAAFIVLTVASYPYVYLPVLAAFRRLDPGLDEVSRMLGRSSLRTFLTVTTRQIRTAAVAGALLVAFYTLGEFGAVSMVRYHTLAHRIFSSYRTAFDRTPAAVLACVLVAITLTVLIFERLSRRADQRMARLGSGAPRQRARVRLRWVQLPALATVALVLGAVFVVPLRQVLHLAQRGRQRGVDWEMMTEATTTTLRLGALGALVTMALAVPVGIMAARFPGRLSNLTSAATYAGHALPGVVVGLSLVFFGSRYGFGFYRETPMLIMAYAVLFLALGIGAVTSSVAQAPPVLDEVSRTLGRSAWRTWWTVTFRLSSPGIAAGGALVFLAVMKELPATLMLRPADTRTLADRLWVATDIAAYGRAAPYAIALVLVAAVPTALLSGLGARRSRS